MDTKRFNQILREVGGREVPELEEEEVEERRRKAQADEGGKVRENVLLRETVTARFDPTSGNAVVTVPLAERQDDEDFRRARFNKHMRAVGGREV
jgi:hypothetical protein